MLSPASSPSQSWGRRGCIVVVVMFDIVAAAAVVVVVVEMLDGVEHVQLPTQGSGVSMNKYRKA